jgi:hypothetical protein
MKKPKEKMYIVSKYVMADSVAQAIRREPKQPVHEVFVDDDWRKNNTDRLADAVGFVQVPKETD